MAVSHTGTTAKILFALKVDVGVFWVKCEVNCSVLTCSMIIYLCDTFLLFYLQNMTSASRDGDVQEKQIRSLLHTYQVGAIVITVVLFKYFKS